MTSTDIEGLEAGWLADGSGELTGGGDEPMLRGLLRRIALHDESALHSFYDALCGRVFRQALRLVRDLAAAEEVVEDSFWQVWREARRHDPARDSVAGWIGQIVRARALEALHSRGRSPLQDALALADGARLQEALAALQPLERQLVALAFLRGCSHSEIAEQTGLPLGSVKSNLRCSLDHMKRSLQTVLQPATPEKGRA